MMKRLYRSNIAKLGALAACFLGLFTQSQAQDVQFSQYYASSLLLNPAMAGIEGSVAVNSSFRSQWRTISAPFITSQVSVILPVYLGSDHKFQTGGFGATLLNDQAGDGSLRTTGFLATAAYAKHFNDDLHRLSFALQGGYIQRSLDFTNLQWGEQWNQFRGFDPSVTVNSISSVINNRTYPLFNFGAMWSFNPARNFYRKSVSATSGIVISNLNQPNESFIEGQESKLPIAFKYHGNLEFNISRHINFHPAVLYVRQNQFQQMNMGGYLSYLMGHEGESALKMTELIFGVWYRAGDALIYSIGLSNQAYSIGFSYDVNNSSLQRFTNNRGAYEITFTFRDNKDNRKLRRFDTPRI